MYKYIDSLVFISINSIYNGDVMFDSNVVKGSKNIQDFKALVNKGFARPNTFAVDIEVVKTDMQPKYRMNCFQAQIPGSNIATTERDIGFRSVAYQKIFGDVILAFYVDAEMNELQFFQKWVDTIVSPNNNHFSYPDSYHSEITITSFNRIGTPAAQWVLHDAYPKQVDPISLDYGTNNAIMTANITLAYRNYTHHYKQFQPHTTIAKDVGDRTVSDFQKIDLKSTINLKPADGSRNSLGQQTGGGARQGFAG